MGESLLAVFTGEYDLIDAKSLESMLERVMTDPPDALEIDLGQVTFLGSDGLGMLVRAQRTVHAAGGTFAIIGASDMVRRLLTMTNLAGPLGLRPAEADPSP